jgi:hypothetical protein
LGPLLTERSIRNIEAVLVLVGAIAAAVFVPSETLIPIAVGTLAVSAGGVYAIRRQMQRLDRREFRDRRALLLEIGMVLGMAGFAAFIVLLTALSD